ncbi:MAG: HD domain-containing protein [Lachnospiraceae bacterium]|nr:HD domain-containing protein [Lachnospiraceae bacterium]
MTDSEDYKEEIRKNWYHCIGLCFVGIFINLVLYKFVTVFEIPLWLDTIGTVLTAVLGGYLPGIIVGFASNLLNGFTDTISVYYAVLSVLISVCATFLSNRGWLKKAWTTILFAAALSLIGGGIGGILPRLITEFPSQGFLADLYIDFIDKLISVTVVQIILYLIPKEYKNKMFFHGWRQRPLTREEERAAKKVKYRTTSVRSSLLVILLVSLVFLSVAATTISLILYRNSLISLNEKTASNVSAMAANTIDPELVERYVTEGESVPGYKATKVNLQKIKDANSDLKYLYVYQIQEDGCHVVFDLDTEDTPASKHGDVIPFDESFEPLMDDLFAGNPVSTIITDDSFGWLLTAYTPVYNDRGKCICYAGADIDMSGVVTNQLSFAIQMVFLFLGFVIVILAIAIWYVDYRIIYPVNAMALGTQGIDYEEEDAQKNLLEKMKKLDIHTGDEIENLYQAFLKMMKRNVAHTEEIGAKNETISKMQNSLIMVLADMVESRDQNTGEHVRKTAAYVKAILLKMRELGIHADVLTDEYISNVVSSAPLHDIGKIAVPDAILNKPGKLDELEFDIMKTHTTAGKLVIDRVIEQVPESSYLTEAREIAHHHHEKWNGQGYPDGLAGEDIPLSARVMAVADVFDALVSIRVYKKPMSLEKALGIIREETGSHFDPEVSRAFFAAEDEVREIERVFQNYKEDANIFGIETGK